MKVPFTIGDTQIDAVVHQNISPRPTLLNLHDDEDTSVDAGKAHIAKYGGRVIELAHSNERLITFSLNGTKYAFDPNRIFSAIGIVKTLKKHSVYSTEAHAEIKAFAEAYLRRFALNEEPVIIALHNTVEGIFSIESFGPAGYLAADAAAIHISHRRSKFDFFYVTESKHFDHLRDRDFNVVLQDNKNVTDDGSLSVHCAHLGIPYINVEAEMRHLKNQIEMLKAAAEMVGQK